MKKFVILIAFILGLNLSSRAQENSSFVPGPMSINSWTGQLTVGGVTIEKEL